MSEIPVPEATQDEHKTITDGFFEEELYIDADSASAFLRELADQLEQSDELTLTGEGWTLPFAFREPIELDIEFQGSGEPELEIELEFKGRHQDDTAPNVE